MGGYVLSQSHYIDKMLNKFSHLKIKETSTPFDSSIKLVNNDERVVAQLEYVSAIGSLMYVIKCSRSDIAFTVNKLSRFTSNSSVKHWKAMMRADEGPFRLHLKAHEQDEYHPKKAKSDSNK